MSSSSLFNTIDWRSVEDEQKERMRNEIADLGGDRILGTSIDDLCDYFEGKYRVEVPELDQGNAVADQCERDIDVSNDRARLWSTSGPHYLRGTEVSLAIPFSGEAELLKVQPSTITISPPCGDVEGSRLILRIKGIGLESQKVRLEFDQTISKIEKALNNLRANFDQYNREIKDNARRQLQARRKKLLARSESRFRARLPLKERSNSPRTYAPPEIRRRIKPSLPPKSTAPFKPEPALLSDDYEHILKVLEDMAQVMERSPSAFRSMDEESIRWILLVPLNGHYEGQATGETFNYSGKTDVLLRVEGKNIFIAECKYWDGPKKLLEALDQLLAYSSWRDTKVALIIFNRRRNFSAVLEVIVPTISQHPNFKRSMPSEGETKFRFVLSHKDDLHER
jgi:hypothetical protein